MYQAKLTPDYMYGSTETIKTEKGEITTRRIYNNFHLLISEETTNHAHIVKTEIAYHSLPNTIIEGQALNFRYPHKTTDSSHQYPVAPNILGGHFHTQRDNQVWVSDISYIPT